VLVRKLNRSIPVAHAGCYVACRLALVWFTNWFSQNELSLTAWISNIC